jgi:hypothetical protein
MVLKGSEARMLGSLWQPVPPCGGLWHPVAPCGGGLDPLVVDGWEEGTGRTEDIEDLLDGLRT